MEAAKDYDMSILMKQYRFVLARLKTAKTDRDFEKWLKMSKILKDEIIAIESRGLPVSKD